MSEVCAVNTFRLQEGVSRERFEAFSRDLDRPTCLALDVVLGFEVYLAEAEDAAVDVVEVMTVSSWEEWEKIRDGSPDLVPVVEGFNELVDVDTVTTVLTRRSPGRD